MKIKLVEIEWVDSASKDGWRSIDDAITYDGKIKSFGFMVQETKDAVVICSSLANTGECHGPLTIPKVAITKKRVIKVMK